jgi:hypothetical protein
MPPPIRIPSVVLPGTNGKGIPFNDTLAATKQINTALFGSGARGLEKFRLPASAKLPPAVKRETTGYDSVKNYAFTLKDLGGTRTEKLIGVRVANPGAKVDAMYLFDSKGKKVAFGQVGTLPGQAGFGWSIMMQR